MNKKNIVAIRGAGDLATGISIRLWRSGFRVILSELETPLCIRRTVAFADAVFKGSAKVENAEAILIETIDEARRIWAEDKIPVIVDPDASAILSIHPDVLIDARLMKSQRDDIHLSDAPLVIGLGPGFTAGKNVHAVIETMRGHNLGRVYWEGSAEPNTGIPGLIQGEGAKRVVKAPCAGTFKPAVQIGDMVKTGDLLANIDGNEIHSVLDGVVRGIIYPGIHVEKGLKIMDVDPRGIRAHCFTCSDKANALGGAVLEAILTPRELD